MKLYNHFLLHLPRLHSLAWPSHSFVQCSLVTRWLCDDLTVWRVDSVKNAPVTSWRFDDMTMWRDDCVTSWLVAGISLGTVVVAVSKTTYNTYNWGCIKCKNGLASAFYPLADPYIHILPEVAGQLIINFCVCMGYVYEFLLLLISWFGDRYVEND